MIDRGFVSLVGDLGLRDAPQVRERLLAAVSAGGAVVVDARDLTGADLTILQLLAAAHKSAAALGRPIRLLAGPEGALRAALVRAGFVGADGTARAAEGAFWLGEAT
jgi:anti-anti-sigma regulatory factor